MNELTLLIEQWAMDKSLAAADPFKQLAKVIEELGETAGALARGNTEDLKDGLGDVYVTIVILAMQNGLKIEDCVEQAYNEIKDRKGQTRNGVFIKQEDL